MTKKDKQQNPQLKECVLSWIEKLSAHFNSPQEEDQIVIFLHALRNCTTYQVDVAFEKCLNECQFMPKLAEVHARMPEQRWPPENPGRFLLNDPPFLDVLRPICRELHPNYDSLDVTKNEDRKLIFD